MKTKYIVIGIVAILLLIAPNFAQAEVYGDKTCNIGELFPGMSIWFCMNPDGGMDHSFFTYEAMNNYYTPVLEEIFVPATTYLYVTGGTTETFSGT